MLCLSTCLFAGIVLAAIGGQPAAMMTHATAVYIRSIGNMAKCLGVANGRNGAPLVLEDCQMGNANSQQWTYQGATGQITSNRYPG